MKYISLDFWVQNEVFYVFCKSCTRLQDGKLIFSSIQGVGTAGQPFKVSSHLRHRLRKRFLCVYLCKCRNMCILYDLNNPSEKEDGTCLPQNDLLLPLSNFPFSGSCGSYILLRQEHLAMGQLVQHRVH